MNFSCWQVAYQAGFSVQSSFYVYAVALCIPLFFTFLLFPTKLIDSDGKFERFPKIARSKFKGKKAEEICSTKDSQLIGHENALISPKSNIATSEVSEEKVENPTSNARLHEFLNRHNMTFLLDRKFYFFLFILSILTLRKEFFVISYDAALVKSANGNQSLVEHYSAVFGIVQFFAILVTPIGGIIIDYSRSRGKNFKVCFSYGFGNTYTIVNAFNMNLFQGV